MNPSKTMDSGDGNDEDIVATSDMCHYCFDTLLKELLPEAKAEATASSGGLSDSSRSNRSAKRRQTEKNTNITLENIRERLEQQLYTPPDVECPLFITWSKLRHSSSQHPPVLTATSSLGLTSGMTTPASTRASSSNMTEEEDDGSNYCDESQYDLRGCIGTLSPKPLTSALSEFAITSAIHDQRFDPISLQEVPQLRVGVSLLVKYEECEHCMDWIVGVHGIIIKFESLKHHSRSGGGNSGSHSSGRGGRTYSATYLPEVAYEQSWTQEEAVISLVRKAGYRGSITDELLGNIRCTRYQSSKFRLSYREYAATRYGSMDPLLLEGGTTGGGGAVVTAEAVGEAIMRQKVRGSRTCVTL